MVHHVRGGVGFFAGRPAYKWFNGVYTNTGLERVTLSCDGSDVPSFTPDLERQPTTCGRGPGVPFADVNVFDPAFKSSRYLKLSIGFDRRFPHDIVGSADVLVTRGVDQFYLDDLNLQDPSGWGSPRICSTRSGRSDRAGGLNIA